MLSPLLSLCPLLFPSSSDYIPLVVLFSSSFVVLHQHYLLVIPPLIVLTCSFLLLCYLPLFSLLSHFLSPFSPSLLCTNFPCYSPSSTYSSSHSASHLSLTSFCLISFPYPYLFTHFPFLYRSLLTYNTGQCSPSILAQAGGR